MRPIRKTNRIRPEKITLQYQLNHLLRVVNVNNILRNRTLHKHSSSFEKTTQVPLLLVGLWSFNQVFGSLLSKPVIIAWPVIVALLLLFDVPHEFEIYMSIILTLVVRTEGYKEEDPTMPTIAFLKQIVYFEC